MRLLAQPAELQPGPRPVFAAIGVFDGLHLGHQAILHRVLTAARHHQGLALAITFDRHPNTVVSPHRAPLLIQPLTRRLDALRALGLDATLLLRFDEPFSRVPADDFIRQLATDLAQLKALFVGERFTFGHRRAGDLDLLQRLGSQLGFVAHGVPAVEQEQRPVSSTWIREAIQAGDLNTAARLLGRRHTLVGPVVRGDQLGRQINTPTANLDVTGLVLPPSGVYAARALLAARVIPAVLNIGLRPTLAQPHPQLRVEAHLLDFHGDLYDQSLELDLVARLRDERTFPGLPALQQQIQHDIAAARARLAAPD
jgi:riboflavin kinase/FMN adenylyltransferase